jgi:RHS repeat-associated protein
MVSDGTLTEYGWDHRNRLTSVTFKTSGGTVTKAVQYEYDAYNRLVTKKLDADGNGTVDNEYHWIHDGNQPVLQFDGNTAADLSHRYLWGPAVDQFLADETADDGGAEDVLWPLGDWQGSERHLAEYDASTDATTIANEKVYDAYGNVTSETNSAVDTLFAYTGRFFDEDTGLQWNLNRWYDPKVGRFVLEDPIGFLSGDPNWYRYVGNSPGMFVDPSGLEEDEPSFWDFDGRLFDSEPSYFKQHGGASGDRRGAGQVLDEHAQRGCGSLKSGDGDALGHMNLHQSAAKSDFAAAAWNEAAFILEEIMWELGTAGIGHGVGATVEVVQRGWVWARKSQIVVRHGDTTIAVSDDLVQKFWKHERGLGKKPSSLDDIGKAIQRRIDDSSCAPRFGVRKGVKLASELYPQIRPGTKAWKEAVDRLSGLGKAKANVHVRTATEAKQLLKEARGNMNHYKQYTRDGRGVHRNYSKGYEVHNDLNPRELAAGNDLPHIKWYDSKSSGHIYYDLPN